MRRRRLPLDDVEGAGGSRPLSPSSSLQALDAPGPPTRASSVIPGFTAAHERLLAMRDWAAADPTATPYFKDKYAKLSTPDFGGRLWPLVRYELSVARVDLRGRVVLDAGCGSGMYSVILAAHGAERIHALDFFPENITTLARLARHFDLPIHPQHRDVTATGLPDRSVDFIYCVEAISHFHDWQAFVDECARLLRPGGTVLIGDGNNGANRRVRAAIHAMWRASECGPFTPRDWPPGANLPYLFRRWDLIRSTFPSLRPEEVFQLGMRTAGAGGAALLEACRRYLEDRSLPEGGWRPGLSQSRPEDGQRNEEPIDPRAIAARFGMRGLRARVRPHFGFSRGGWLRLANRIGAALTPLAIRFSLRYLVIATRAETSAPKVHPGR
jgi:2-polyprenyl-3-methyl-5-hydroxy-6-metoxy-1,4-benzoquinol methylase